MKNQFLLSIIIIILGFQRIEAQINSIYSKTYGKNENPVIIFIHGGPGGNATLFEGTTAQILADKGFYVIAYDRRGEGRSIDSTAIFTYDEAIKDLNEIYRKYNLQKANILAHSFGGLVGTLFTKQNPEKVQTLILTGALFSQQETYNHILKTCNEAAIAKNDRMMISKISETMKLDKNSAEYRKQCYEIASQNEFFKMPFPTTDSKMLRKIYDTSEFGKNNIRNDNAPVLFYRNENRNNINTKPVLKKIKNQKVKLFAIYGKNDGIFSLKQMNDLEKITTKKNFKLVENCSHYLFVDQQNIFLDTIVKWLK